jgi:very-short-patch-repair endonuclease
MNSRHHEHRHNVPAARDLRARETPVEDTLWEELRARRLDGMTFHRQHPIGPFVVDFCCPERRLAIELDGGIHAEQQDQDAKREAILATAGYRVIRFPNQLIRDSLPEVLAAIRVAGGEAPLRHVMEPQSGRASHAISCPNQSPFSPLRGEKGWG